MSKPARITEAQVLEALKAVTDPEKAKDVVTLNMIRDVNIDGGKVSLTLVFTDKGCANKSEIENSTRKAVNDIPGVEEVTVRPVTEVQEEDVFKGRQPIPGVKHTIAVASGKGGVGKS
ncbi:MAG: metal-sulfur cluster assembly factor, partial [Planctomycetota bacterium]